MSRHKIKGERVLVTGGAGAVGSTLTDLLVPRWRAGDHCAGQLDNFVRIQAKPCLGGCQTGRCADAALVTRLTRGIDFVFHQAAIRITQCAEEPRLALEVMGRHLQRARGGGEPGRA
jgi:UDP-glucose 4-epimerase